MFIKNEIEIGRNIIKSLEKFGELDWYRYGPIVKSENDLILPHMTIWRFKEENEHRDQLIVDAVKSFNRNVQWMISFRDRERLPGRNWSIAPKRFEEFLNEIKDNSEIIDIKGAFAEAEPEIGKAANQELPNLAEHIEKFVNARLSVVQQQ
jgi:sulfatase maturation enzyme AslB (radical SAM superfamily)